MSTIANAKAAIDVTCLPWKCDNREIVNVAVLSIFLYAIKCCVSYQLSPKQLGSFSGIVIVMCG